VAASPCVTPPAGLVSWWRAEGDGTDFVGNNDGVLQGGLTFAAGEVGQAFSFNGVDGNVQVPASATLDVGQGAGLTIEAWINPVNTATEPIADWSLEISVVPEPGVLSLWVLGWAGLFCSAVPGGPSSGDSEFPDLP
jgi:hypothetical protein